MSFRQNLKKKKNICMNVFTIDCNWNSYSAEWRSSGAMASRYLQVWWIVEYECERECEYEWRICYRKFYIFYFDITIALRKIHSMIALHASFFLWNSSSKIAILNMQTKKKKQTIKLMQQIPMMSKLFSSFCRNGHFFFGFFLSCCGNHKKYFI